MSPDLPPPSNTNANAIGGRTSSSGSARQLRCFRTGTTQGQLGCLLSGRQIHSQQVERLGDTPSLRWRTDGAIGGLGFADLRYRAQAWLGAGVFESATM